MVIMKMKLFNSKKIQKNWVFLKNFFNYLVKIVFSRNISCFLIFINQIKSNDVSYLTQKTIKKNVSFSGIALHSGLNVNVCIKPAEPNFGIVFKRVDLKKNNLVYPNFMNVTNTSLNTTIENEFGVKVSTIEHLMGALFGLGIDNALIEIDNEEVPILDGSAKIFIEKIISAGIEIK